jgi:transcriptional regulator GlxA family with amidase domain
MDSIIAITFLIFDNFTALDVIGPYEILSKIPNSKVYFVGLEAKNYTDGKGLTIKADYSLEDIKSPDILLIPGGQGIDSLLNDNRLLDWIRNAHKTSKWTTSVCSGALLLASSGILDNKTATTHWNRKEQLRQYGVNVVDERYHKDGKIITSAGVSAGIDMALYLLCLVTNENYAKAVQLGIEYDPSPPFDCGSPGKAPKELLEMVKKKANKRDTN